MDSIKTRKIGKTNMLVAELGLGAMDTPQIPEGEETIQLALDAGINFIDTARIHQDSEYLIGKVIRERAKKDFYISTKTMQSERDAAQHDVDRSLRILGTNHIDLYQLGDVKESNWDQVMTEGGALEGLKIAQIRGLISYIGLSSHDLITVERAIRSEEFDAVMVEYSAFYPDSKDLIELAHSLDVGIITMRPLGGSGRTSSIRTAQRQKENYDGITAEMLLKYVLSNQHISVAIPGVRYPSRISENVSVASTYTPLDESQKSRVESLASALFS
jgi:hypothetical protein